MKPIDLVQGTLDLLILKSLLLEPQHGWAIAARIRQLSNDVLLVQQGSLYPALQRLEHQGWITAKWGVSEQKRRAKDSLHSPEKYEELAKWEYGIGEGEDPATPGAVVGKPHSDTAASTALLPYPAWAAPALSHGLLYLEGAGRLVCLRLFK